jgi:hypothetical protein
VRPARKWRRRRARMVCREHDIDRPGRPLSNPAQMSGACQCNRKAVRLAGTAGAPRPAAAAATNAAPATTAAAATAAPAAAASAAPSQLLCATADVFLVEDMERRQADVCDFFLAKGETLRGRIIRRLWDVRSRHSRGRRATNQGKRQPGSPQGRYGFAHTLPLRSWAHTSHSRFLRTCKNSSPAGQFYAGQIPFARLVASSAKCHSAQVRGSCL